MTEHEDPIHCLALDPGRTIGWACWKAVTARYQTGQISSERVWYLLEKARVDYGLEGPIVVERFMFRQGLPKIDFTPVEVIGIIKEWARQNNWTVVWQTPAEGKFYFTDQRIKDLCLWKAGKPHAMDALRHLLYFRRQFFKDAENEKVLRRKAWEDKLYGK